MTAPLWVREAADHFWQQTGTPPPFPRDLTRAVTDSFLLSVHPLPRLSYSSAMAFLGRVGVRCEPGPDRPLRGLLFCRADAGFILYDAADPPDEQRFTIAHEVAHFLRDYDAPRRAAVRALGPDIREVLDGRRPPTVDERLHAVLRRVALGPHVHLMGRDDLGRPDRPESEHDADRLALELLAPADLFSDEPNRPILAARLASEFGLPPAVAADYAATLRPPPPGVGAWVSRLKPI